MNKLTAAVVATMVLAQGCATPGGVGPAGGDPEQVCSPLVIGLGAGLACGLLVGGNDRLRAAAACAAVATLGCYMLNSYKAQQVRTAQQVEDDYLRRNRQLPEKPVVSAYRTEVNPKGAVAKGQKVGVESRIVVVPGRNEKGVKVEEELFIVDAAGERWGNPTRKLANTGGQAGEYHTSFKIPVHDGMSQGVYTLRKTLLVNGAQARNDDSAKFQVVAAPDGTRLAMALQP